VRADWLIARHPFSTTLTVRPSGGSFTKIFNVIVVYDASSWEAGGLMTIEAQDHLVASRRQNRRLRPRGPPMGGP
jgi:hypothetical protein